jgi:outer membrane protein assembly factor BamB
VGDEPVGDPDAMWKRGYSAPDDGTALLDPEPNDAPREWFAHYGRSRAEDSDDESMAPEQSPPSDPWLTPLSGAESAVERHDDEPADPRDRRPRTLLVATMAMAVVAVAGVVWQIARDDVTVSGHRLASIPSRAVPAWIAELDTGHVTGIIGTRSTIVVLELVSNDLVGLAADSGVERWRVKAAPSRSIARLEEADGAAIVLVEENTGDRSIAAYDVESGERLWREHGLDRSAFVAFQGSIYRIPAGVTDVAIERLDPHTGDGLNVVASDLSSVGWAHVATVRDDVVEVFDLQTLARVGGPIEIGSVAAATAFDGRVVGLGRDATIRMYGSAGDELASLRITVDRPDQFDIAFTPEPVLLVMDDREITGYSLNGDRIAQIWKAGPVQVNEITEVGDQTYAVVQTVVAAGPNGGPVRVVDAATGVAVAEPSGGNWVRLGRDGFVVEITDDDGVRQAVEAYGYDGDRRWRFELAREQQGLFLVDGAVVLVASDAAAQKSTLTYLN